MEVNSYLDKILPERWQKMIASLGLLTFAIYFPALQYGFFDLDDGTNLFRNPKLVGLSFSSVLDLWTHGLDSSYTPLSYTVWALILTLGNLLGFSTQNGFVSPSVFHFANLLLHATNASLLFGILRRLTRKDWAAFMGAALFVIHPFQVESVVWISNLKALLSTMMALSSVWYAMDVLDRLAGASRFRMATLIENRKYQLAVLFGVLSMLAKPTGSLVWMILFAIALLHYGMRFRPVFRFMVPWGVAAIAILGISLAVMGDSRPSLSPHWTSSHLLVVDSLVFYLARVVFPWGLAVDYGRAPERILQETFTYLSWIIPCLLAYSLWRSQYRTRWMMAAAIFLATLLPLLLGLAYGFPDVPLYSDRWVYLPMIGVCVGVAFFSVKYLTRSVQMVAVMVGVLLAGTSGRLVQFWGSSENIYRRAAYLYPTSWLANNNLGSVLQVSGRYDEAAKFHGRALRYPPQSVEKHQGLIHNMILALSKAGRFEMAAKSFGYDPAKPAETNKALNRLGMFLLNSNLAAESSVVFEMALKGAGNADSKFRAVVHQNLATALSQMGRPDDAESQYRKALALVDKDAITHHNLGVLLASTGKYPEALTEFKKTIALNDKFAAAYFGMARVYMHEKKTDLAREFLKKTLEKDSQFHPAREALLALGKPQAGRG